MEISVIIPSYKPQDYIWQCLASLNKQTLAKEQFEIILVLNGCCEPYKSQIEEYASKNSISNLKLIQTDKGGVSNARNIGMDASCGEYITFIDDDDYVSDCYLQELYNGASKDVVSICYPLSFKDGTNLFESYHITKVYDRICNSRSISIFKARSFFSGPVYKMIHRSIIGDAKFDVRLKNGEDTLFMFAISKNIKSISLTSRESIYYRRFRRESASSKKKQLKDKIAYSRIQLIEYLKLYFTAPLKFNFPFFFTRICGNIVGIIR